MFGKSEQENFSATSHGHQGVKMVLDVNKIDQ